MQDKLPDDIIIELQLVGHTAMPTLVLAVDQFSWMMSSAPQALNNY